MKQSVKVTTVMLWESYRHYGRWSVYSRLRWKQTVRNWRARTNRSNNCTSCSNKPRQHCLLQGMAAPGGRGCGEEIRPASGRKEVSASLSSFWLSLLTSKPQEGVANYSSQHRGSQNTYFSLCYQRLFGKG